LTERWVVRLFVTHSKVRRWLERYPAKPATDATFDRATRQWRVHVWSGRAGEIATGRVEDPSGLVLEAWTGPQVAWKMARGRPGAFGGKILNAWWVWVPLSLVFFLGLVDRRRPLSWHSADVLALLSFGISLWFFNRGEILRSVDRLPGQAVGSPGQLAGVAACGRRRLPRRLQGRSRPRGAA
jgi:hypothetical protein